MGEIASVYAKVGADLSGFRRGMNEMDSTVRKSGGAFRSFTQGIVQGMGQAFGQAAIRGIREFGDAMAGTLRNAASLEQGVADIAALMGLTADESAKVSKLITDLGVDPKLKVTAFEAAGAIEMLGKNGLTLEQILGGAARSTILLSNATGGAFPMSADIATSAMAMFKIKAEDMGKAVNQIVGTTTNSKLSIEGYRLAIAQAGGVAGAVGIEFDDFNSILAATAHLFGSGSDQGTALKTFVQRLVPDTVPAAKAMKELGIITEEGGNKFFTASGQIRSAAEVAGVLKEAFSGLSEEQKILSATNIFGTDAMRMAFGIADAGAEQLKSFADAIAKADADVAGGIRMDTLSGDWEIFQGILETLSIQIGQQFLPAARGIVQWATQLATEKGPQLVAFFGRIADMLPSIGRVAMNFFDMISGPGVTKTVGMLAQGFATLGRVLATLVRPFKEAFGGLMQQLSAMRTTGFADVFSVILHRIGQAITGFAKLITTEAVPFILKTLRNLWEILSDWVSGVDWSTIKSWAKAFWEWAVDLWSGLSPHLLNFWKELSSWVTDPAKRQQLWNAVVTGWNVFSEWAVSVWEWMKPGLIAAWNFLSSWVTDPAKRQQLWNGIVTVWNVFTEWSLAIWNWMAPGLLTAWNFLSSWVTDPAKRKLLWDAVVTGWNVFSEWAQSIWNWVSPHLGTAWQFISSWITDPTKRQIMLDTVRGWGMALSEWAGWIWNGGGSFEGVGPKLGRWWSEVSIWVTDPTKRQALEDTARWWGNSLTEWATYLWSGGDGFEGLRIKLDRWWGSFRAWMEENFPKTDESLMKLINSFKDLFKTLGELFSYENEQGIRMSWRNLWGGLDGDGKGKIDTIIADITDLVDRITRLFSGLAKILIGFKNNEWGPIWEGIAQIAGVAIEQVKVDATDLSKFIPQTLDMQLMSDMRKTQLTWSDIWAAIGLQPGKAKDKIINDLDARSPSKSFQKIADSIITAFDGFGARWSAIWNGLTGTVTSGLSGVQGAIGAPLQSVVDSFNNIMDNFKRHAFSVMQGIGQDIGNGMAQGIRDKINGVIDVLNYLAQVAPDWVRKALGIASPSKVFIEIGKQVTAGFAKGIADNMSMPEMSLNSMVRHTVEAVPIGGIAGSGSDGGTRRIELVVTGESALPTDRAKLQELSRMLYREMGLGGVRTAY